MEWGQTAAQLCLQANVNRDSKKRPTPFKPDDFNPFAAKPDRVTSGLPLNRSTMAAVARAFTGKRFDEQPRRPRLCLPPIPYPSIRQDNPCRRSLAA